MTNQEVVLEAGKTQPKRVLLREASHTCRRDRLTHKVNVAKLPLSPMQMKSSQELVVSKTLLETQKMDQSTSRNA